MEWLKARLRGTWVHRVQQHWTRNSIYDRETVAVMRRVLKAGSNCIDIGAHEGVILQEMVRLAPEGRHHAFEPLPHLAKGLRERFPQVSVHEAALGDRGGRSEFLFVENGPGLSGLRRRVYRIPNPKIIKLQVRVETLDEAIPRDEPIAFIKLDVEGGEYHVLKGGMETIRRWRPVIVLEAEAGSTGQYGVSADELFDLLSDTLDCEVSTMRRWLGGKKPYTREAFRRNWNRRGGDYYFIAAARKHSTAHG